MKYDRDWVAFYLSTLVVVFVAWFLILTTMVIAGAL